MGIAVLLNSVGGKRDLLMLCPKVCGIFFLTFSKELNFYVEADDKCICVWWNPSYCLQNSVACQSAKNNDTGNHVCCM